MTEKCKRCGRAKHMGRCKKADLEQPAAAKAAASRAAESEPPPVSITAGLEVEASLGFRASIESGSLCLEQDRPDDDGKVYTHAVSLSPHEARKLVDWVAEFVESAATCGRKGG